MAVSAARLKELDRRTGELITTLAEHRRPHLAADEARRVGAVDAYYRAIERAITGRGLTQELWTAVARRHSRTLATLSSRRAAASSTGVGTTAARPRLPPAHPGTHGRVTHPESRDQS